MAVLNRKLFNRGGPVSSRGVGITSGLVPVKGYANGGTIEQDAEVVLFVYRPIVYSKKEEDEGQGEIIISKHRNGPTGIINVTFFDKYARFENMDMHADEYFNEYPG